MAIHKSLILFLIFSVSACAQLSKQVDAIKPTAKLTGTRLVNIDFDKIDLVFDLAVENRNPVPLKLAGLDYDLKIENQSLVSGVSTQALELKADATSPVQIPVSLKFVDLKKLPGELWKKDRFNYQLDTIARLSLPVIGNYALPVSKNGTLPVPKAPEIKLKNVKINKLGFTSADLIAQAEIFNPNSFDLGLSDLNYQLFVEQKVWGQGKIQQPKSIPKRSRGSIEVPIKLDLMSMGSSAYKMLQSKSPLDYRLKGDVVLDSGLELMRNFKMPLDIHGTTSLL